VKHYQPEPGALLTALVARVDDLEHQVTRVDTDTTALGRGVAELTRQIRGLTDPTGTARRTGTAPGDASQDVAQGTDAEEAGDQGQRDWFDVTDQQIATEWLTEADQWIRTVGTLHRLEPPECWSLHPDVVTEVLALSTTRAEAYDSDAPTTVSEFLSRWLPGATERITTALSTCSAESAHVHDSTLYSTRDADLSPPTVAAWWTSNKNTPAHLALHLRPLD
jgi:hypothetical protein